MPHRPTFHTTLVALAGLLAAGHAGAAATALHTTAQLTVQTMVELYVTEGSSQSNDWQPADPLAPLQIGAHAFDQDLRQRDHTAEAWAAINARFDSAARGHFSTDYHWDLRNAPNPSVRVDQGAGFSYTFTVDRDSLFRLDGTMHSAIDDLWPDLAFSGLTLDLAGGIEVLDHAVAQPSADGLLVNREWQLPAGGTYTLRFSPCCSFLGFGGTHRGDFGSQFDWVIVDATAPASVPTPPGLPLTATALVALAAVAQRASRRSSPSRRASGPSVGPCSSSEHSTTKNATSKYR